MFIEIVDLTKDSSDDEAVVAPPKKVVKKAPSKACKKCQARNPIAVLKCQKCKAIFKIKKAHGSGAPGSFWHKNCEAEVRAYRDGDFPWRG